MAETLDSTMTLKIGQRASVLVTAAAEAAGISKSAFLRRAALRASLEQLSAECSPDRDPQPPKEAA